MTPAMYSLSSLTPLTFLRTNTFSQHANLLFVHSLSFLLNSFVVFLSRGDFLFSLLFLIVFIASIHRSLFTVHCSHWLCFDKTFTHFLLLLFLCFCFSSLHTLQIYSNAISLSHSLSLFLTVFTCFFS